MYEEEELRRKERSYIEKALPPPPSNQEESLASSQTFPVSSSPEESNRETRRKAEVRREETLCEEEQAFLLKRKEKCREALQLFLNRQLEPEHVPTIAFCASGGGYRAMISTAGFLRAAEEIGLYQTCCYFSAISGSAWFMAQYYSYLHRPDHEPPAPSSGTSTPLKVSRDGSTPIDGDKSERVPPSTLSRNNPPQTQPLTKLTETTTSSDPNTQKRKPTLTNYFSSSF
jgi:hypothetical protein